MQLKSHWETIFGQKAPHNVSWYQPHLEQSLRMVEHAHIGKSDPVIDVGGGASTLVDDLLTAGYTDIAVLDISGQALQAAKQRLADRANVVTWIESDIAGSQLPAQHYMVWHDRALFHFLIDPRQQQQYVQLAMDSIQPGGSLIMATFAEDGPEQCSGLNTSRFSPDALRKCFAGGFELEESIAENHETPWHSEQKFIYCRFTRKTN